MDHLQKIGLAEARMRLSFHHDELQSEVPMGGMGVTKGFAIVWCEWHEELARDNAAQQAERNRIARNRRERKDFLVTVWVIGGSGLLLLLGLAIVVYAAWKYTSVVQ